MTKNLRKFSSALAVIAVLFTSLNAMAKDDAPKAETTSYKVRLDYRQSLVQMVAAGRFGQVNDMITTDFRVHKRENGGKEIIIVHFNREMSLKEALAGLKSLGLRPAELPELCALGAQEPELQRSFPIVGLGSFYKDEYRNTYLPFLIWRGSERRLSLDIFKKGFSGNYRFAAVRK